MLRSDVFTSVIGSGVFFYTDSSVRLSVCMPTNAISCYNFYQILFKHGSNALYTYILSGNLHKLMQN